VVVGQVTAVYGPTEVERCCSVGTDRLDGCRGSSAADTRCVGDTLVGVSPTSTVYFSTTIVEVSSCQQNE